MSIEMLEPEQVDEMWPVLEPMLSEACQSHAIAKSEFDAETIRKLTTSGMCALIVAYGDAKPTCVLAIQFHDTNGRKGADVIAFAGRHMMKFKGAYWEMVLEWLRLNEVEFLDAYVPRERAEIYQKRFGFTESCVHVRMMLHRGASYE